MNTPDTITISIARGRWSVSRSCDLDLLTARDWADVLSALFEEAHHAFTDAARHLDQFAEPKKEGPPF